MADQTSEESIIPDVEKDEGELQIPKNLKELKACLDCGIILN